jgi:hypothetical protein
MVVLADEVLESFFGADLSGSFRLDHVPEMDPPSPGVGLLGDIWSTIASDNNVKIFNKVADEFGKTIGKHQVGSVKLALPGVLTFAIEVIHRPSIGRYTKLEEPKGRESLLTPTMRRRASKSSLFGTDSNTTLTTPSSRSTLTVDMSPDKLSLPLETTPFSALPLSAMPVVKAANAALMERTPFAIDDAKDDDDDSEDQSDEGGDDQVLDEVCDMLTAMVCRVLLFSERSTLSWKPMTRV